MEKNWMPCTSTERANCKEFLKDKSYNGCRYVCDEIPTVFCPKLFCEGESCAYFTKVVCRPRGDGFDVVFPCSQYNCPGNKVLKSELAKTKEKFLKDTKNIF